MSADESGTESGAEFRAKFEATQAENAGLRSMVAETFGVDAEQLKGVPVDQIKAKAEEVKAAQAAQEDAILRRRLGLGPDDDLESALKGLGGSNEGESSRETTTTTSQSGASPFASAGQLGGMPVGSGPQEGLRGRDRIKAGIQANRKK